MSDSPSLDSAAEDGLIVIRRDSEGSVILTLTGEIDMVTAPYFKQELEVVQGDAPTRIVVDLGGVSFIDSSGLAVLVRAAHHAAEHCYKLLLRRPSRQTAKLFDLAGADRFFTVID